MKRLLLFLPAILATATILLCAADETKPAAAKPLKVLMVTGGCCHDYANQKLILAEGLSARANVEFTIVHEGPEPKAKEARTHKISIYENADWAKGYDIILHNECFGAVDDVAFVERIAKPHHDGVPAVMLHCSTHSYRAAATDEWRKCVGQKSMRHEKNHDILVKNVKPEHPVMKGFPTEWLDKADELYENLEVYPNVVTLATSYGEDMKKDHTIIWVNTYGDGKIFGTTLGHNNSTMEDPVYLDLVARGLLWACGKLDENGKPVAGYGPTQK